MGKDRSLQSRSAVTRAKLIEATLNVIHEVGFKAASTELFAKQAGVSRGAMLYHFPTRHDLTVAASQHLLRGGSQAIHDKVEEVNAGRMTMYDLVDYLWSIYSGRFFYLSLEMVVEARNNPEFRAALMPVLREFHNALDTIWQSLHAENGENAHQTVVVLNLTVCLMRGMGVQTVLRTDKPYYDEMVALWKQILPTLMHQATKAEDSTQ